MSKKPAVLVTSNKLVGSLKELRRVCRVEVADKPLTKRALQQRLVGKSGLVTLLTTPLDRKILESLPDLRVIANYAVGYDNIDLQAATELGVAVVNTPGVLTEAVAEHTFALILALSRQLVVADTFVRKGLYQGWQPDLFVGQSVNCKTIGIVGAGRIGAWVAKIAHYGFNMRILYHDQTPNLAFEEHYQAQKVTLNQLLKQSDVVTLHVPLLESTHHLISTPQLKKMKKTSILINTSRGPVVDEKALVLALQTGQLGGAGLDVFEKEPRLARRLKKLSNVILTPHIASATNFARSEMTNLVIKGLTSVLKNKKPKNLVNPEVWSGRRK